MFVRILSARIKSEPKGEGDRQRAAMRFWGIVVGKCVHVNNHKHVGSMSALQEADEPPAFSKAQRVGKSFPSVVVIFIICSFSEFWIFSEYVLKMLWICFDYVLNMCLFNFYAVPFLRPGGPEAEESYCRTSVKPQRQGRDSFSWTSLETLAKGLHSLHSDLVSRALRITRASWDLHWNGNHGFHITPNTSPEVPTKQADA